MSGYFWRLGSNNGISGHTNQKYWSSEFFQFLYMDIRILSHTPQKYPDIFEAKICNRIFDHTHQKYPDSLSYESKVSRYLAIRIKCIRISGYTNQKYADIIRFSETNIQIFGHNQIYPVLKFTLTFPIGFPWIIFVYTECYIEFSSLYFIINCHLRCCSNS